MRRFLALFFLLLSGCSINTAKKHYVLAEQLWTDGKYAAAVTEFDKVTAKEPASKLGLQALFRSASTQALFLSEYGEAVRKFKLYAHSSDDKKLIWEAEKQIGDIYFNKTEQYDQAISHYQELLKTYPTAEEAPEYLFRVAKSQFYLWKFADAVENYKKLMRTYPNTPWAERSYYEIGVTYFTRGEKDTSASKGPGVEAYQEAIDSFQSFLKKYPQSTWVPHAKFGIASCLEELDQLDAAYHAYKALRDTYPSPKVIDIKLARIHERKSQRSR